MEATIIKKDGKATLDKPFEFMLSLLRNGEYTLTIKRKTKPRTLNQNALMWQWFRCIGPVSGNTQERNIGAPLTVCRTYMISTARNF